MGLSDNLFGKYPFSHAAAQGMVISFSLCLSLSVSASYPLFKRKAIYENQENYADATQTGKNSSGKKVEWETINMV